MTTGWNLQTMPALMSSRLLIFGKSAPFQNLLHVSRKAWFCSSVSAFHQVDCDHGSLTLESLGFRNIQQTIDEGKPTKVKLQNSHTGVLKTRVKAVKSNVNKSAGIQKQVEIESAPFVAKSFSELDLPQSLMERLESEGFRTPTDVQSAAIPTILKNHDVVIQSYTGSGKTLAYLLPILSEVGPLKKKPFERDGEPDKKTEIEAVIVAPSRELAMQIVREVEKILGPANRKAVQQLVGGANRSRQEEALRKNKPSIIVGTPGRISEISAAGKLHTHGCRYLVLDEVDELLSFNFREAMHRILDHVGRRSGIDPHGQKSQLSKQAGRQTILVSATVPFSVIRAARSWGRDPLLVQATKVVPLESILPSGPINLSKPTTSTSSAPNSQCQAAVESLPPSLKHYHCVTMLQHKVDTMRRCVHALDAKYVIAFMNNTKQLKDAVFKLEARGMKAAELHGDLGKLARSTTLKKFKNGEVRVLVTNELSARGLDVPECDLVVNLDLPTDAIHYAHRAGRTGRLGRKGTVVNICEEREVFVVKKLQKQLGMLIPACEFVEGKLIATKDDEQNSLKL